MVQSIYGTLFIDELGYLRTASQLFVDKEISAIVNGETGVDVKEKDGTVYTSMKTSLFSHI